MSIIEIIAVIAGLICVYLVIKQSIWCWPAGLIQVTLYIYIFYEVKLYSDVILHVIYVILNLYGWYHWLYGGKARDTLPVTDQATQTNITWLIFIAVGTLLWGWFMATNTDASLPYPDAFTTVASLSAQWLMARKRLESWVLWIVVDIVATIVYYIKGLYLTSGLYFVFLIMATVGLFSWRKSMLTSETSTS
ncbi:MAG: nicotinamide riboside transporter PnuC [Gammaproteobacteria bacterium]|nr:nicotinamide riboside transporter PnuC [Gammaproteobacteria bacterium]